MRMAIVGCGELGSRHAQSLAKFHGTTSISLVDPSVQSLIEARRRVKSSGFKGLINSHSDASELMGDFFLVVVSTSSKERASSLRLVLQNCNPQTILLEKLLAPNLSGISDISDACSGLEARVWVNCPMPFFAHYESLHRGLAELTKATPLTYRVKGGNLGLVSNSIHYLDHFACLTGRKVASVVFGADSQVTTSKRAGYSEILGSMTAETRFGDYLNVDFSSARDSEPLSIEVQCGSSVWKFDETNLVQSHIFNGELVQINDFTTPLQSNLTHASVLRICQGLNPHWADLELSLELHRQLFVGLNLFFGGRPTPFFT